MNAPLAKEQIALLMSDSLTYRTPAVEGTDGTIADPHPTGLSRFVAFLRRAVAAVIELPRRRAVMDELALLTDRELADIGLNRAELNRVFDPRFAQTRARDFMGHVA